MSTASWPMRSAMASAEKPISISRLTWLWRMSCMRMRFTPDALHPRSISWARKCLVTANRRSSGATSSRISMKSAISSRRKAGMTIVRTDLGVLGSVTVSMPWRLWYDLLMRSRELSSMKSDGVSARSSPQRMPVQ